MRFMIVVKATADSEAGVMPPESLLLEMQQYHEELAKAGVLLGGDGLQATSKGWRINYDGKGGSSFTDGPFAEAKELIAGYTLIQVKTREEAIAWTKRFPNPAMPGKPGEIEVRQVFELEDFAQGPAIEKFEDMNKRYPDTRIGAAN